MDEIILETEAKWLSILYEASRGAFEKKPLPSHDQTHHLRVWILARELFSALRVAGRPLTYNDAERLIISVFFHDTGLTVTLDPEHGRESRKICEAFFKRFPHMKIPAIEEVYTAIEHHDDKTYSNRTSVKHADTLILLSICDDLDAYGRIGVYRYLDIYTARHYSLKAICRLVIRNLDQRFGFLNLQFGFMNDYMVIQRKRKEVTAGFFLQLSEDIHQSHAKPYSCPAAIVKLLTVDFILPGTGIDELTGGNYDLVYSDRCSQEFFVLLKQELLYFTSIKNELLK